MGHSSRLAAVRLLSPITGESKWLEKSSTRRKIGDKSIGRQFDKICGVLIFGKEMGENYILALAGKLTSSYRAKQIAFKTGLQWMQLNTEFVDG